MLKARSPALFAGFMTQLCAALEVTIKEEYGVFDKFTGDGVLAFFPEFFSGKDAGYHANDRSPKSDLDIRRLLSPQPFFFHDNSAGC